MSYSYQVSKSDLSFKGVVVKVFGSVWADFKIYSVLFIFLAVFSGVLLTAGPKIFQKVIDMLVLGTGQKSDFFKLLAIYFVCLFLGHISRFISSKVSFYIATQIEDKWRFAGLRHYYDLYFAWHDQHDSGWVGNKIDKGGGSVYVIIHELFGDQLLVSLTLLTFVLAYSLWLFPILFLFLVVPIPIYVCVTYVISKKITDGQARLNVLSDVASRTLYDGVANVRTVKSFGSEKKETKNYASKWGFYHTFEYGVEKLWFKQTFIQSALETILRTLLIAYCIYSVWMGKITIGEVTLIMSYQQMTFYPLQQLNQLFTRIKRNAKKVENLFQIMSVNDLLADTADAIKIESLQKEIIVDNVHFEYSKKVDALYDVNLKIPQGTTTALVGRSGAGKSTFALLLMRFYDPSKGSILFDGVDMRKIQRESLRKQIAWIPQDTSLFNRSIKENIAYGNPYATDVDVKTAAKLANAHEFILKTPKGYDSIIGERGVRLSGGQRQRIAIARALLMKPSVLILDESTSHLDSETEKAISESIKHLHHKTTQIIIAHRLSTILHADQIVVMDKGRIVAVGKHNELLKNQIYKRLYELQFHKNE